MESPSSSRTNTQRQAVPESQKKRKKEQEKHIGDLPEAELQQTAGKCVLIDPGRRDLLFAMHENSSIESKQLYRYTANQKSKETRSVRYTKLRTELKDNCTGVKEAEADLSNCNKSSVDPDVYDQFLATRARVIPVLKSLI